MPSLTSSSVLNGAQCPFLSGVASPPRGKGREKRPERHTCGVPAARGDALPRSIRSPGKKDWLGLLKKNGNLETNSFILKDTAVHTKGCFKSAEVTGTYAALVNNWVDGEFINSS
jgi:hypothetical protein